MLPLVLWPALSQSSRIPCHISCPGRGICQRGQGKVGVLQMCSHFLSIGPHLMALSSLPHGEDVVVVSESSEFYHAVHFLLHSGLAFLAFIVTTFKAHPCNLLHSQLQRRFCVKLLLNSLCLNKRRMIHQYFPASFFPPHLAPTDHQLRLSLASVCFCYFSFAIFYAQKKANIFKHYSTSLLFAFLWVETLMYTLKGTTQSLTLEHLQKVGGGGLHQNPKSAFKFRS